MEFPEQIKSQRLVLTGLKKPSFQLAEQLYRIVDSSRTTLREWLPWVDKTQSPEDEYTHFLVDSCQAHWREGSGYAYAIIEQDKRQILGCIDLWKISEQDRACEIGYWLSDDAVGHGYMQEALKTLETQAFKTGLNRIVILNDTQNARSVNVAKRAGYVLEGVLRQNAWDEAHNRLRDTNVWAKLKSDWEHQHG